MVRRKQPRKTAVSLEQGHKHTDSDAWSDVAMTVSDIAAILTGERMMARNTSDRERPSRDEIARLAYEFYETRGRQDGQDVDDWLAAEHQLARRYL
jgi:hypothetical protein